MKKVRWYQFMAQKILLLLFFSCAFAAGYELTKLIFIVTGRPAELVAYVLSGLVGVILLPLIRYLLPYFNGRTAEGKYRNFPRAKLLTDTLDAVNRIAQGDFKVFVATEDESGPYSELAASVNKMARELDSMEKLRQDFISNVSHEIKSPLTSISGYASLLKREGVSTEQIAHYAAIIDTESKRLSKLSDNLLRLSTLEADGVTLETKPFRLDKQLENLLLMLEPQWAEKNIMPDVSLPIIIMEGNEDLLSQVWINLLHNAIKFTPENGSIRVMLTGDKDNVICTVADNGIGISPEDQIHIFERFYKVDKSRDCSLGGNGLGLSLMKKIVEMHEGWITVKSKKGQGAEFIVTLPNHGSQGNGGIV
ncbi:MAG TPA: HAMP domain-containing sensor histidine kinase [Negativicutes bacterium]|jgi:signal transduction histidine kinase